MAKRRLSEKKKGRVGVRLDPRRAIFCNRGERLINTHWCGDSELSVGESTWNHSAELLAMHLAELSWEQRAGLKRFARK